ncbi:MAG TPA: hypothetical protein VE631_00535, partial [Alphaproteobacteria bacterium]|nr:hypothetical protein [Alphaproteobacteria bacterium]
MQDPERQQEPDRDAASRYVDLAGGLAWPASFGQFEPAEQLVLWALRRWIVGLADMAENQWTLVCRLLTRRFGKADGEVLVRGLARYLHTICCHPRRPLRYHQPCCPGISGDEIAM